MNSGIAKINSPKRLLNGSAGFTMVELVVAVGMFVLLMMGALGVFIMSQKLWRGTSLSISTSRLANLAIERMTYGIGTNSGLRSATASVSVNTNMNNSTGSNYWDTTTASPPAASSSVNDLSSGNPDGSWRIVYSNVLEGVKYIDYAKGQRSIVMWPNTNQAASRLSICNYVSSATVTVTNRAITIQLTVWKKDGKFVSSNQVSAFVKMRN